MWYKDSLDQSLELCQSRATSTRAPGAPGAPAYMCTLLPEPGIYDDALPLVFPDNWPPEMFWFLAETAIPQVGNSGYELEVYVAGVEAAFAAETLSMVTSKASRGSASVLRFQVPVPTPSPIPTGWRRSTSPRRGVVRSTSPGTLALAHQATSGERWRGRSALG